MFELFNRGECRHIFVVDPQSIRAEFLGGRPFSLIRFYGDGGGNGNSGRLRSAELGRQSAASTCLWLVLPPPVRRTAFIFMVDGRIELG